MLQCPAPRTPVRIRQRESAEASAQLEMIRFKTAVITRLELSEKFRISRRDALHGHIPAAHPVHGWQCGIVPERAVKSCRFVNHSGGVLERATRDLVAAAGWEHIFHQQQETMRLKVNLSAEDSRYPRSNPWRELPIKIDLAPVAISGASACPRCWVRGVEFRDQRSGTGAPPRILHDHAG